MFLWFGTIANKKKTLVNLLDTLNDSLQSTFSSSSTFHIKYSDDVEEYISIIEPDIKAILPTEKQYLSRWVSLKLLDENSSINIALQKNLNIDIENNTSIQEKLSKIKSELKEKGLSLSSLRDSIVSSIILKSEDIRKKTCTFANSKYNEKTRKIDKILTSKRYGIPIMLTFLALIFWLTIAGANYPSQILSGFFGNIQDGLLTLFAKLNVPDFFTNILIYGMYQTVTWVVSVMLPPMAIFFPLFTLLEDLGYLPRIAFNLDNYFKKACSTGKQALTMCMGVTKWEIF